MPELPEVETIVNDLKKRIIGSRIAGFETGFKKAVKYPLPRFKKEITGRRIGSVSRIGKHIVIGLSSGKAMLVHLRMTGHLLVGPVTDWNEHCGHSFQTGKSFIRHRWLLENKSRYALNFSDVRKFGTIKLVDIQDLEKEESIAKLGIDPLSPEFTSKALKALLGVKNVKSTLMDQGKIAGIGNIYASEILYKSKISPEKPGRSLADKDVRRLYGNIKKVLKAAIDKRGTTISDYRDSSGATGKFQESLRVYGREGKKCLNGKCKGRIKRKVIGQRSTFYCPQCQK